MSGWKWFAGDNDEIYRYGPHESREDAVNDAIGNTDHGDHIFVVEAIQPTLRFDAGRVAERLLEDFEDHYGDESEPDRRGTKDAIDAADAELQVMLDAWLDKHRETFSEPDRFVSMRNAEDFPRPDGDA